MASPDEKIKEMIDIGCSADDVIAYVKTKCREAHLKPRTLGMLFEVYSGTYYDENDPASCFSREISIEELKSIHPDFQSTNGCQWARSDTSYLGKKYIIKRKKAKGKVSAVKLDGANDKSIKRNRGIKKEITDKLSKQRCAVLDVSTNIEIDHKDGHYDVLSNQDIKTQRESDFQPLSKAANDAKRSHCSRCISTGKRYDAKQLGYSHSFILGDEDTKTCQGCYWYDPKYFNSVISKNYKKDR